MRIIILFYLDVFEVANWLIPSQTTPLFYRRLAYGNAISNGMNIELNLVLIFGFFCVAVFFRKNF